MDAMKSRRDVKVYKLGQERVLPIGPLTFHVKHRYVIIDGVEDWGASIDVMADIGGKETEVLSFDCFKNGPHYHAPGSSKPISLDPKSVGDGLEWTMGIFHEHLPEMLSMAGYMDFAKTIDRELFAKRWVEVKQAVLETAPAAYVVPVNAQA